MAENRGDAIFDEARDRVANDVDNVARLPNDAEEDADAPIDALIYPYPAANLQTKCRITTRGLHRVRPYEIPECIGGKLIASSELIVDAESGGMRGEGCCRRPTMQTQMKEKWNKHNVGKDFNTICQEAKWKGLGQVMYPWALKPVKLTPCAFPATASSALSSATTSSKLLFANEFASSDDSPTSSKPTNESTAEEIFDEKMWSNFASLALKSERRHTNKSHAQGSQKRALSSSSSSSSSVGWRDTPRVIHASKPPAPSASAPSLSNPANAENDALRVAISSKEDKERRVGKSKASQQLPLYVKRRTCSQEALDNVDDISTNQKRSSSTPTTNQSSRITASNYEDFSPDDVTVDELSAYLEDYLCLPKKMSSMAEMMYT